MSFLGQVIDKRKKILDKILYWVLTSDKIFGTMAGNTFG